MALIADFGLCSSCLRFFSGTEKFRSFAENAPEDLLGLASGCPRAHHIRSNPAAHAIGVFFKCFVD
jgi:hypothetical protein